MTTLTDFLLARIAEDEAAARGAGSEEWASLNRSWDDEAVRDIASVTGATARLFAVPMDYDEHVARHDPARVLAECKAKRRIVEWCGERDHVYIGTVSDAGKPARPEHFVPGAFIRPEDSVVLRFLALPYADHPDYREEWRP